MILGLFNAYDCMTTLEGHMVNNIKLVLIPKFGQAKWHDLHVAKNSKFVFRRENIACKLTRTTHRCGIGHTYSDT